MRAEVALRLLEVIRDQDVPVEVLEEEDPTVTMPRKLGLSDVVERQIRSYREDAKRGVKLTDAEIRDLFRLVIRRPDGEEIFSKAGRLLAGRDPRRRWRRALPAGLAQRLARIRLQRRLKALFGRRMGGFSGRGFTLEGRALLFVEADPGGDACALLTGLSEAVLEQAAGRPASVTHSRCQARGDALCRWEGSLAEALRDGRPRAGATAEPAEPAPQSAEETS